MTTHTNKNFAILIIIIAIDNYLLKFTYKQYIYKIFTFFSLETIFLIVPIIFSFNIIIKKSYPGDHCGGFCRSLALTSIFKPFKSALKPF